ncbi:MbnP family copper-binding protein [Paraglaciecola aestuariivivens]
MKLFYTLPIALNITKYLAFSNLIKHRLVLVISTLLLVLTGCSKSNPVNQLNFELWFNGEPLTCQSFETQEQQWFIRHFAFFVSQLSFTTEQKILQPALQNSQWQSQQVSLLMPNLAKCSDVKQTDATAAVKSISAASSQAIVFAEPIDLEQVTELHFSLGVPFALNHQNPLQQESPFNLPTMFWSWRAGHKFFRLDLHNPQDNWVFHLGSVGCESASVMRGPKAECLQPNRVQYKLNKMQQGTKLVLHLDRLFNGLVLQNEQSCLFNTGQSSCQTLVHNLHNLAVFEWH